MGTDDFFADGDTNKKKKTEKDNLDPKTINFEKKSKTPNEEPKSIDFSSSSKKGRSKQQIPNRISKKNSQQEQNIKPANLTENTGPNTFKKANLTTPQPIADPEKNQIQNPKNKGFIAGFLVSFSKEPKGETWILNQGKNIIGSGINNNIILNEKNVSDQHAWISIRRSKKDNRLLIGIIDDSDDGTLVNGIDIDFSRVELSHGDIITIGGYELLLVFFDKDELGLRIRTDFEPLHHSSRYNMVQDATQPYQDYAAGDPFNVDDPTQISSE